MAAQIITLPSVIYSQVDFKPVRPGDTNQMDGRRSESQIFGTPYWIAKYTAERLTTVEAATFDAFEMDIEDGCLIEAYDAHRPRPIAYQGSNPLSGVKAGGGAFNGDAVLQSITNSRAIVVSGLPANFQLSKGDYLEIRKSTYKRSLHRIMANAVASGAGVVALSIRFGLDLGVFTLPCTVRFEKPTCLMMANKGSFSMPKTWPNYTASFSATEFFPNEP
ncbi:hypothetical protein AM571_CH01438 [Rhizobium etli 8C-3]|uniref:Uncharacterized protein n=1 Tax=Rhizobium etli 8C-3 TaxID=538025 RepID=A0A1L5P296_RHIET|nr:hypothetical protein [Rhizobium etli]APO74273.1 hypothetical protein AM571_CH01438 [Rhizobium etli 8C-3]